MALDEYKRKRDFSKTPEPAGTVAARKARERFFCVQKHLASHLHYDLRLEHNGVLLSWAVPKGPSLDPKTKRLAMHVEDHPVEYGEFEGVIPEGYGAGVVMLWDRGTWTPEVEDVDAALKKGDLKFQLNGYKLKGSWVLVRTHGWGSSGSSHSRRNPGGDGGPTFRSGAQSGAARDVGPSFSSGDQRDQSRSWLLIKHADDWSGDLDITTFAPLSVKSEGNFADIVGEDAPAIWRSNRPAKSGDAGAMFARIIDQAERLKAQSSTSAPKPGTQRRPAKARRSSPASAQGKQPAPGRGRAETSEGGQNSRRTQRKPK